MLTVLLQDVFARNQWQGWGKDSNDMCPPSQASGTEELLCEPSYPGGVDPANMSWPGVVCTPTGTVLCISLPDLGLTGDISILETLSPLNDTALIDLSGNKFAGMIWVGVDQEENCPDIVCQAMETVLPFWLFCCSKTCF